MYLSRLRLDPRRREVRRDLADCQGLHRTLLSAFPDGAPGESGARAAYAILYRVETPARGGDPIVLVQSAVEPDWSGLPAGYLRPGAGELPNPTWRSVDAFWAALAEGQRLRFRLRANATKKVDTKTGSDGRRRNGRRVALTGEADQIAWLDRKGAAGGFRPEAMARVPNVRVIPEDRLLGRRPDDPDRPDAGRGRLTFGSVLFEGILTIADRAAFVETLRAGIGSGKAYGFGLLSIARVSG